MSSFLTNLSDHGLARGRRQAHRRSPGDGGGHHREAGGALGGVRLERGRTGSIFTKKSGGAILENFVLANATLQVAKVASGGGGNTVKKIFF